MKPKHIQARIAQCLAIGATSNCIRRKFGALALDPETNVLLVDAYNGGPRGGGDLCGGTWCVRDGLTADHPAVQVTPCGRDRRSFAIPGDPELHLYPTREQAEARVAQMLAQYPALPSGTQVERGCVHAEQNLVCNAARLGVRLSGAWVVVTGEPCLMCAKLLHHAGVTKVLCVDGGYMGANGVGYLRAHGVEVEAVEGPKDPRVVADPPSEKREPVHIQHAESPRTLCGLSIWAPDNRGTPGPLLARFDGGGATCERCSEIHQAPAQEPA